MPDVDKWDHGSFCWAELSTSDAESAKAFYSGLFGWEVDAREIPGGTYNLFQIEGKGVGACFEPPEGAPSGPPNWKQYISVDDVDQATKSAEEAGATVVMAPFDVMGFGRMSSITDPTGADIHLWQTVEHAGWHIFGEENAPVWNELMVPDTEKASAFYETVFGWKGETQDWGSGPYTTFTMGEKQVAGLFATPPDAAGTPPMWTQYFSVADANASVEKAKELGGTQLYETRSLEKVGTFAGFADPQGAVFAIIQAEPPQS